MPYLTKNIRNVIILGHQGSGKTSLVESLAFKTDLIKEKGSIEKKNTLSDFLDEEKKRQSSISSSIIPLTYKDYKINLIDVPGNDDFVFEALGVSKLIKGAILVIDAQQGIQVGTIKHYKLLRKRNIPIFIFINKMDKENVNFNKLFLDIQTKLDPKKCVPFSYPIGHKEKFDGFVNVVELKARKYNGKECVDDIIYPDKKEKIFELHNTLVESVATTSEELLDKFFSGEALTNEEIKNGLRKGVLEGELFPIVVGSAIKNIGINTLLNMLIDYLPSPVDLKPYEALTEVGGKISIPTKEDFVPSLYVFKNIYDPYQGLVSIFKVNSGSISLKDELYCPNNKKKYKITSLFSVCGNKYIPVTKISAGDIGATSRLDDLKVSYTLCSEKNVFIYKQVTYPTATYFKAIIASSKKDSDKLFPSLEKIMLEDPTITIKENPTTNQILVGGLGTSHLNYIFDKLKNIYKINFTIETPKIVYKETITTSSSSEGRYIKQSGGAGYYGVVNMNFEPGNKTEFKSTVFGGHIDKGYFPAIEKGFLEALQTNQNGLINAPVINVIGTLTDGKQHSVDSNEMAFKNAAILAFKEAYRKCNPVILEPFDRITINVDPQYLGTVLSDLSKRRSRILSTTDDGQNNLDIVALVPESEILEYANELKSLTKGTAFFNLKFEDYERVPEYLQEKLIKKYKK